MDILLTWIGSRDPAWTNPRTGTEELGPVLSLLEARQFDAMHLFYNLGSRDNEFGKRAAAMLRACQRLVPRMKIVQQPIELVSVIDYREIFRVVNDSCQRILESEGRNGRRYYVYLSPGTPQMQTSWVLLVQSGLLPATMLEGIPRDFVAPGAPWWREVELSLADFPQVSNPAETARLAGILEAQNANLTTEKRRLQALNELLRAGGAVPQDSEIPDGFDLPAWLLAQERAHYLLALTRAEGNASEAARLLGIQPHTFRKRAEALGVRNRRLSSQHT